MSDADLRDMRREIAECEHVSVDSVKYVAMCDRWAAKWGCDIYEAAVRIRDAVGHVPSARPATMT